MSFARNFPDAAGRTLQRGHDVYGMTSRRSTGELGSFFPKLRSMLCAGLKMQRPPELFDPMNRLAALSGPWKAWQFLDPSLAHENGNCHTQFRDLYG